MTRKCVDFVRDAAIALFLLPGLNAVAEDRVPLENGDTVAENAAPSAAQQPETIDFTASVWADNWFALYVNGQLVGEDSVPITKMRSFNSDTITFRTTYPLTIALVSKDCIENDSGLEYIGSFFGLVKLGGWFTFTQQIGDGGLIAQIAETESGKIVAATSDQWRGLVIHKAPLNSDSEKSRHPMEDCKSQISKEPVDWQTAGFDDSAWVTATEYTKEQIGARFGYNDVAWDASAKLIWTDDIKANNVILWRYQVTDR